MNICLVGNDVRGLYGENAGGIEIQNAVLARCLAQRGNKVTFVVVGYDGAETTIDGVRVCSGWLPGHGIRGIRYVTYRLPTLGRTLQGIGADVYFTLGGGFFAHTVNQVARRIGAVALLGVASDRDLYVESAKVLFSVGNSFLTSMIAPHVYRLLYAPALRTATCIIVQNLAQEARCDELGLPHRLIPNIVEIPPADLLTSPEDLDAVWVGNISTHRRSKGFAELIRLIKASPNLRFGIVGDLSDARLSDAIRDLKQRKNVRCLGSLSHGETLKVLARSKFAINTSPSEGVSNAMLEGWSLGKPAITLHVNPNNLLNEGGLGLSAQGDLRVMASMMKRYAETDRERRSAGERCRQYIESHHSPAAICQQYESFALK